MSQTNFLTTSPVGTSLAGEKRGDFEGYSKIDPSGGQISGSSSPVGAAPPPKRVPVDYRHDQLSPTFLKALAQIAGYAASKYGSVLQYRDGRLIGEKGPINHAKEHIGSYQQSLPHDHFGTLKMQLAAAAYNLMMEWVYLEDGRAPDVWPKAPTPPAKSLVEDLPKGSGPGRFVFKAPPKGFTIYGLPQEAPAPPKEHPVAVAKGYTTFVDFDGKPKVKFLNTGLIFELLPEREPAGRTTEQLDRHQSTMVGGDLD